MALTSRGRALRWLTNHRGITEQPAGSNCDTRKDGIRAAQLRVAGGAGYLLRAAWCGTWFGRALIAGGVSHVTGRIASVAFIEDDARAGRGPFNGWHSGPFTRHDWERTIFRGDGVVLFGRGIHVATLRDAVFNSRGVLLYVITDEGNTSSGNAGSQDNGGGAFRRVRPASAIHGIARVNYPNR